VDGGLRGSDVLATSRLFSSLGQTAGASILSDNPAHEFDPDRSKTCSPRFPLAMGTPQPVKGATAEDNPIRWSGDGMLFVRQDLYSLYQVTGLKSSLS